MNIMYLPLFTCVHSSFKVTSMKQVVTFLYVLFLQVICYRSSRSNVSETLDLSNGDKTYSHYWACAFGFHFQVELSIISTWRLELGSFDDNWGRNPLIDAWINVMTWEFIDIHWTELNWRYVGYYWYRQRRDVVCTTSVCTPRPNLLGNYRRCHDKFYLKRKYYPSTERKLI